MSISLYERLGRCPLQVQLDRRNIPGRDRNRLIHPNAALGLLVHRAFEIAFRQSVDLGMAWASASTESSFAGIDFASMPSFRRTRLRAEKRFQQVLSLIEFHGGTTATPEVEVKSRDGSIEGRVDLLVEGATSFIVDFKTGIIHDDDDKVASDVARQLLLYGALAEQSLDVEIGFGYIISMKSDPILLEFDAGAASSLLSDIARAAAEYNHRVASGQPAQPASDTCRWCRHLHECGPLKDAVDSGIGVRPGNNDIVWGSVVAEPRLARNDLGSAVIQPESGTIMTRFRLFDIPRRFLTGVAMGTKVVVTGLGPPVSDEARRWSNGVTQLHCQ